jgi:hypothetical protein
VPGIEGFAATSITSLERAQSAGDDAPLYGLASNPSFGSTLFRVSAKPPGVDVICPRLPVFDRLSIGQSGAVGFGAPRSGSGVLTWSSFPDCAKASLVGFADVGEPPDYRYSSSVGAVLVVNRTSLGAFSLKSGKLSYSLPLAANGNYPQVSVRLDDRSFSVLLNWHLSIRDVASGVEQASLDLGWLQASPNSYIDHLHWLDEHRALLSLADSAHRVPGRNGTETGELVIVDVVAKKVIQRLASPHDDDVSAAALVQGDSLLSASWDGTVKLTSLVTGNRRVYLKARSQVTALAISPDKRSFVATRTYSGDGSNTVALWRLNNTAPVWTTGADTGYLSAQFSIDGTTVLVGGGSRLVELRAATGAIKRRYRIDNPAEQIARAVYMQGDKVIFATTQSGNSYIWRRADPGEQPLLHMVSTPSTWLADSKGRFDVRSFDQLSRIGWLLSDTPFKPLRLDLLMRDYYEPRLLPRLLENGEDAFQRARPLSEVNRVQPIVRINSVTRGRSADEAIVDVEALPNRDSSQTNGKTTTAAYDLRLFRNGQLVAQWPPTAAPSVGKVSDASWLKDAEVKPLPGEQRLPTFTVRLAAGDRGRHVDLSAYAFNENRVKSETVHHTDYAVPDDIAPRRPHAYVIAIGVNTYENPKRNLQFAVSDAQTLISSLHSVEGYDVVPVLLVSSAPDKTHTRGVDHATREDIRATLGLLSGDDEAERARLVARVGPAVGALQRAAPDDLVVLTFSGHGHTERDGRFFLLPSDSGSSDAITAAELLKLISSEDLSRWIRPIDAGQFLIIIDACHAAELTAGEAGSFRPGPMGDRGLGQLAYDKGIRILAATQAGDIAIESQKLGQGLLTYALTHDGLREGHADINGDHEITLTEWLEYGANRVPTLFREIREGKYVVKRKGEIITAKALKSVTDEAQTPELFDFDRSGKSVVVQRTSAVR